jgi:hypothetical protein
VRFHFILATAILVGLSWVSSAVADPNTYQCSGVAHADHDSFCPHGRGTVYITVCRGPNGNQGTINFTLKPGEFHDVWEPKGSTYGFTCDGGPPNHCPGASGPSYLSKGCS